MDVAKSGQSIAVVHHAEGCSLLRSVLFQDLNVGAHGLSAIAQLLVQVVFHLDSFVITVTNIVGSRAL